MRSTHRAPGEEDLPVYTGGGADRGWEATDDGRYPRGDQLTRVLCPACRTQLVPVQLRDGPVYACSCSHPAEYPGNGLLWKAAGIDVPAQEQHARRASAAGKRAG
jgi:hypothetical protein